MFALLLSFYILAKVVDDYFVESLDKLANKLKMSSDAAGATLMAVGSSAPELFVALFAVFHPDGNHEAIGVGNIVGSALFNILAIVGAAAIVRNSNIAWQSVVRDLAFYAIAIGMLLFVFHDGKVELHDALLFIGVYIVYVVFVVYWRRIFKYKDQNEEIKEEQKKDKKNGLFNKIVRPIDYIISKIFPPEKYYFMVFILSILIIAGLSWVLVESAVHIAEILKIPEAIIAVTILAAGTSVPDLLSSVIVSKQGRGGMAISNAIGSNIFDILIGLGLPFLLIIIMTGGDVDLQVQNFETSGQFLLASVFVLFFLFLINKWNVGKKMGIFLILLYIAYLVWAVFNIN
ncbi:MAG: calcium/sodium antiporter [bacterium]|nr:calcium/sodium antiporter [bacterium]